MRRVRYGRHQGRAPHHNTKNSSSKSKRGKAARRPAPSDSKAMPPNSQQHEEEHKHGEQEEEEYRRLARGLRRTKHDTQRQRGKKQGQYCAKGTPSTRSSGNEESES